MADAPAELNRQEQAMTGMLVHFVLQPDVLAAFTRYATEDMPDAAADLADYGRIIHSVLTEMHQRLQPTCTDALPPLDGRAGGHAVHKAWPSVTDSEHCEACMQRIRQVPGGNGPVWVHSDTGAVTAAGPSARGFIGIGSDGRIYPGGQPGGMAILDEMIYPAAVFGGEVHHRIHTDFNGIESDGRMAVLADFPVGARVVLYDGDGNSMEGVMVEAANERGLAYVRCDRSTWRDG